jgi:hypothetical protein
MHSELAAFDGVDSRVSTDAHRPEATISISVLTRATFEQIFRNFSWENEHIHGGR